MVTAQHLGALPGVVHRSRQGLAAPRGDGVAYKFDEGPRGRRQRPSAHFEDESLELELAVLARRAEEQRVYALLQWAGVQCFDLAGRLPVHADQYGRAARRRSAPEADGGPGEGRAQVSAAPIGVGDIRVAPVPASDIEEVRVGRRAVMEVGSGSDDVGIVIIGLRPCIGPDARRVVALDVCHVRTDGDQREQESILRGINDAVAFQRDAAAVRQPDRGRDLVRQRGGLGEDIVGKCQPIRPLHVNVALVVGEEAVVLEGDVTVACRAVAVDQNRAAAVGGDAVTLDRVAGD